jgi:hypothetical protein
MYRTPGRSRTPQHAPQARAIAAATRQVRILRRAAEVIDADRNGWPITARDVSRLLGRAIPARDAQDIADVIGDLWASGRMGRDAETDCLRGMAHVLIVDSRRRYRGAR